MRRLLPAIAILLIGFCSCNKEQAPLTKAQIKQKIDSMFTMRTRDADEQSRIDLERRIKIEVKVKADSIFNAMPVKQNDTAKHAPVVTAAPAMPTHPVH